MANQDMLINCVRGEETRIAIVENDKLESLFTERTSDDLHVNNIYRGRVTNVEASIQAAFVDFGLPRSGFLHITDLHPRYFPGADPETVERVGYKTPRRDRPPIQACLKRGQEILVQVLKEGLGTKGPTLTSYLSIPGRYLVLMPYMERSGVSRKVEDPDQRREMRQILDDLSVPENFGCIVRTAGLGRTKTDIKRDYAFLMRLWKEMERRMKTGRGPAELYTESDVIIRTLRDVATADVKRVIVDDWDAALRARQFLRIASPRTTTKVIHYEHPVPLFDAFDMERQIQAIHDRVVPMENGGSLVFDQTEALVAVDVNSGKFRDAKDSEKNAYLTNQMAVDEIARQLRLRDLGGLIVLDLIDMYQSRHRKAIEKRLRDNFKRDRARTKVLRISELGMVEMTRQRMRPSLKKSIYNECPTCKGAGHVLSTESVILRVMRRLGVALAYDAVKRVELNAAAEVLAMLFNKRRDALVKIERDSGKTIDCHIDPDAVPGHVHLTCYNEKGVVVDIQRLAKLKAPKLTKDDEVTVDDLKELDELEGYTDTDDEVDEVDESGDEQKQKAADQTDQGEGGGKKKRRRRRRRKSKSTGDESAESGAEAASEKPKEPDPEAAEQDAAESSEGQGEGEEQPKKRRRRRRGGRRRRKSKAESEDGAAAAESGESGESGDALTRGYTSAEDDQTADGKQGGGDAAASEGGDATADAPAAPKKKRRRRGGRKRKSADAQSESKASEPETASESA